MSDDRAVDRSAESDGRGETSGVVDVDHVTALQRLRQRVAVERLAEVQLRGGFPLVEQVTGLVVDAVDRPAPGREPGRGRELVALETATTIEHAGIEADPRRVDRVAGPVRGSCRQSRHQRTAERVRDFDHHSAWWSAHSEYSQAV